MTKKEDHQKEVRQEKADARAAEKEEKKIKDANDAWMSAVKDDENDPPTRRDAGEGINNPSSRVVENQEGQYPSVVPSDSMLKDAPAKQVVEIEFKLAQVRNDGLAIFRQVNRDTTWDSVTIAEVLVKRTLLPDPVDYKRTLKVIVEL